MRGSKGFVLAEMLVCLAAAAMVSVSAVTAYTSGVQLVAQRNADLAALNAATGAYSEEEMAALGLETERQEFYCKGLARPFYYVTVKNAAGKIAAAVVIAGE